MKKSLGIFIISTLIMTMMGCSKSENLSEEKLTYNYLPAASSSETINKDELTDDDVRIIFEKDREMDDYEIIDSILIDDDKYPQLKAVILFEDKQINNSCNLAFIAGNMEQENIVQEVGFAVNEVEGIKDYEIDDDSRLKYKQNGEVTLSVRKIISNEILDFTIAHSYQEANSINFKIISNKRTKQL